MKPVCPICYKTISYIQCFPVYLDAVPDEENEPAKSFYDTLDSLKIENSKLAAKIAQKKCAAKEKCAKLAEVLTQVRLLGSVFTYVNSENYKSVTSSGFDFKALSLFLC